MPFEKPTMFREILKHVKEGVYFVDINRKITFFNDYAQIITGFSASEVLSRYCYDNILNHVDEEGTKLCLGGCPLHDSIVTGKHNEASVYLHHKEGHRVKVFVRTFPLYDNGQCIGALELFSDDNTSLKLKMELQNLKILAMTDQLTQLANRRSASAYLSRKISEWQLFQVPFAVAMADIDCFKKVNDTYGHDIGDKVLQMTAKSLASAVRSEDLVSRWGGEEFLAVFNATSLEQVNSIANRMRMLVEQSSLKREGQAISVTVSIGALLVQSDAEKDVIINLVDTLLYQSKHNGRNCVSLATL
jgi:diguanylate cyclase (GGDEF)-like protein/PAS domain S-box-containing protein